MTWNIARIVRTHAAQSGEKTILSYKGTAHTYREMDERSNRVAQGLIAEGLQREDRIAILDKNCPEYFEVLFGASKAGIVAVPVNWRLAPAEIAYILRHSQTKLIFVGSEFTAALESVRAELDPSLLVVVFDQPVQSQDDLGTYYDEWIDQYPPTDSGMDPEPDATSLQLYTSGTTGLPKGVMLTSINLFTLLDRTRERLGLTENSTSLVCTPLFHIGGLGWSLAGMRHGGTSCLVREFNPKIVLSLLEEKQVTHAGFVPAMLSTLVQASKEQKGDYSTLQLIQYGTAPIARPLLVESIDLFDCDFVQLYGLTETTSAITELNAKDHKAIDTHPHRLQSAGRPYPGVEVKIVSPYSGQPCSSNENGELWVRSAQNMKGYWQDEQATRETILEDGWLRTGDAGYMDDDGYLFLTDRVKDMIVSGGENVYPAEIEQVLVEHPAVSEVAVIGVPSERWGETVAAIVVPRPGTNPEESDLIDWCQERIARYKCPTLVAFIEELPRNATGKILKRSLREPYWKGRERDIN